MIPLMVNTAKRKPVTSPSHRASAIAKFAGAVATGVTVTMPSGAQEGDLAIFGVVTRHANTITPPSGVTLLYDTNAHRKSTNASGNSVATHLAVYYRWIQAGDASSGWTFKCSGSGNQPIIATVGVYKDVSHIAVAPKGTIRTGGTWGNSTAILGNLSVGPDNLQVGLIATDSGLNLTAGAALVTDIDSRWDIRQADSINTLLANAVGATLVDSPTHGWLEETDITVVAANNGIQMVTLELAGHGARGWFENERVPETLKGKPVYCYGTSNTNMIPRADIDMGGGVWPGTYSEPKWTATTSWPDWLISLIDPSGLGNHMGVGGTHACDNVTFAMGSAVLPTQAATQDLITDICQVDQAGTWKNQTNRDMGGIVFLDIVGNDILYEEAATSQVRDGVAISCETMVRLMRSKHVRGYAYAGTSFTGSWQNQASNGTDSNVYARTLTPGDYVEVTTSDPRIEILLLVVDASSGSILQPGATYEVKVDGVVVETGSTNNRFRRGLSSPSIEYGYVHMAIPIEFTGGGSHTVRVTHTGSNGDSLRWAGYLVPKDDPAEIPYVVLMGMQKMAPWVFGPGQTQDRLDAYLAILRNVAAKFPDGKVLVYDPMGNGQWAAQGLDTAYGPAGPDAVAFTLDGVHMNQVGHAFFALDLLRFLNERIP